MEESSNGKTEETQKINEPLEEDKKKLATSVVEEDELKSEFVTVRDIAVDENSELVNEAHDDEEKKDIDEKKSGLVADAGVLDDEEKKEAGIVLELSKEEMTASETAAVEKSVNSGVKELEREEVEEKTLSSSDKTNGVEPVEADPVANGSEETPPLVPPSVLEKGVESAVVSNETEEEKRTSPSKTEGLSPEVADLVSKGIEENVLPTSDESDSVAPGVTDVVSKGIEEMKGAVIEEKIGESSTIVERELKETEEDNPAKQSADATAVGSSDYLQESTGNPHLISVSQRTPQPTTFRSCCGLFEFLTRSRG